MLYEYKIESLPSKHVDSSRKAATIAVCLAKNNPLLEAEGASTVQVLLHELSNNHESLYILIADEINVYEKMISNGTTNKQAARLADAEGSRIAQHFMKLCEQLGLTNITVLRWKSIEDDLYTTRVGYLKDLVSQDEVLAKKLTETAQFYIRRRNPLVTINDTKTGYFKEYLLHEMVVQLFGIRDSQILYHAVYVPSLEKAAMYQSPVLELKCLFKQRIKINSLSVLTKSETYTARIFVEKTCQ